MLLSFFLVFFYYHVPWLQAALVVPALDDLFLVVLLRDVHTRMFAFCCRLALNLFNTTMPSITTVTVTGTVTVDLDLDPIGIVVGIINANANFQSDIMSLRVSFFTPAPFPAALLLVSWSSIVRRGSRPPGSSLLSVGRRPFGGGLAASLTRRTRR